MKRFILTYFAALCLLTMTVSCSDDDMTGPNPMIDGVQSVDLENTVTFEATGVTGSNSSFLWTVLDPDGMDVPLNDAMQSTITFVASKPGTYNVSLAVSGSGSQVMRNAMVAVANPTYETIDQMGRPAINTVFNYFGDAAAKNGYNMTNPEGGNADPASFEFILDNLQAYIGLDPDTYLNVLGLDNTTTSTVLATDVLMSNKDFPSTYGPSDLNNISLGENVLNGRGLSDDVVDVTLILAFAGDDLSNLNEVQLGLISDNVAGNDQSFSNTFPYLASPN